MGTIVTVQAVKQNPKVQVYLSKADECLGELDYTEHGFRHAELVSRIAMNILYRLEYSEHLQNLAGIAGYLHDIGNVVNRLSHEIASALLAEQILCDMGMSYEDVAIVMAAIGNHDEEGGFPVSPIAAALIIADKSDVHRSRVREKELATFDIHDRVNYAATSSFVNVDGEEMTINLELEIDNTIVPMMEYFEIFLTRMNMCRRAAQALECKFNLFINKTKLL